MMDTHEDQKSGLGISLWVKILAVVGVLIVASLAGALMQMALTKAHASAEMATFFAYTLQFSVTILFALWLCRHSGTNPSFLRFSIRGLDPAVILGGVILLFAVSMVLEPLLALLPEAYLEMVKQSVGSGGWSMLTVIVMAPILEEVLFRGIIQGAIVRQYGSMSGLLIASAIFGVIHLIPQQAINAFFAGMVLGYVYLTTGSLIPGIVIHAINNAVAYVGMAMMGEQTVFYTRDLFPDPVWYWAVYGLCVVVVGVTIPIAYRRLKRM